ncbi:MAG: DUF309 domain-containing protein [Campylobacterales bacterium]|nr:DUF309 domain-containing protein [Campylobacterales bacterium]
MTEAFAAFVRSLNEGRYYDAHEDVEAMWYPRRFDDDDEVRLWKGFINAAVSFELIKRGRPGPSLRAWGNYCKYRPLIGGVVTEHKELYVRIADIIEQLDSRLRGKEPHILTGETPCPNF